MDGGLQLPEPAAAEALAKFEKYLDENPDIGTAWAQDAPPVATLPLRW